jgi:hypothetical protein
MTPDKISKYLADNWYRLTLFLIGCIGTRVGLGLFIRSNYCLGYICLILSVILTIMGLGFLIIFFGGFRKTGLETGGNKIWWNALRPFHGLMYLLAGFYLFNKQKIYSSNIILLDVFIGFVSWLLFHINQAY